MSERIDLDVKNVTVRFGGIVAVNDATIYAKGGEIREVNRRAEDAMSRCGIEALAGKTAGGLSTGQRRLVELARAIATPFTFLLLDEPSSGLDVAETKEFGRVLTDYVAQTGYG